MQGNHSQRRSVEFEVWCVLDLSGHRLPTRLLKERGRAMTSSCMLVGLDLTTRDTPAVSVRAWRQPPGSPRGSGFRALFQEWHRSWRYPPRQLPRCTIESNSDPCRPASTDWQNRRAISIDVFGPAQNQTLGLAIVASSQASQRKRQPRAIQAPWTSSFFTSDTW